MPIVYAPSARKRDRHRRLADPAAHSGQLFEQAVVDQTLDDHRHGLHRQAREAAHVGFRQRPVQADCLQHDALVELPHADLVRTDRAFEGERAPVVSMVASPLNE